MIPMIECENSKEPSAATHVQFKSEIMTSNEENAKIGTVVIIKLCNVNQNGTSNT
jgi:hypothetical protein